MVSHTYSFNFKTLRLSELLLVKKGKKTNFSQPQKTDRISYNSGIAINPVSFCNLPSTWILWTSASANFVLRWEASFPVHFKESQIIIHILYWIVYLVLKRLFCVPRKPSASSHRRTRQHSKPNLSISSWLPQRLAYSNKLS